MPRLDTWGCQISFLTCSLHNYKLNKHFFFIKLSIFRCYVVMLLKNELIYSWKKATGKNNWGPFNNILILRTSKKEAFIKPCSRVKRLTVGNQRLRLILQFSQTLRNNRCWVCCRCSQESYRTTQMLIYKLSHGWIMDNGARYPK